MEESRFFTSRHIGRGTEGATCRRTKASVSYGSEDEMKSRTALSLTAAAYWALCLAILLSTQPWNGGDGSIGFGILINVPSFPAGLVPTAILDSLTTAAHGTPFENAFSVSPLWWLFLFLGCGCFGFLQWFVLLPQALRRIRLLVIRSSKP